MAHSKIYKHINSRIVETKPTGTKNISFSQYSMYKDCPHHWWLHYGQGLYPVSNSIHTVFGTAMHETIQEWMRLMYTVSIKASEEMKLAKYLEERLLFNYKMEVKKDSGRHFSTPDELGEFYEDGVAILTYLKRKRAVLFDTKHIELVGIELPIYTPIFDDNDTFVFNLKIDIIFYDSSQDMVVIQDFKTSTRGWGDKEKKNEVKQAQARLYKHYFSKHMGIDPEKIDVSFVILKRKIWEESPYPVRRMQTHIPVQGAKIVKKAVDDLKSFISTCYNPDGTVKTDVYHKKNSEACKFCPFANDDSMCDKKN